MTTEENEVDYNREKHGGGGGVHPLIRAVSVCVALKNMVFESCCFDIGYGLCTLLLNLGMSGVKRVCL